MAGTALLNKVLSTDEQAPIAGPRDWLDLANATARAGERVIRPTKSCADGKLRTGGVPFAID